MELQFQKKKLLPCHHSSSAVLKIILVSELLLLKGLVRDLQGSLFLQNIIKIMENVGSFSAIASLVSNGEN